MICVGVGEAQTQARENEQATATAMTALAALNAAFGAHLAEWQQVDGRETVSVDPADLGIDARRILYGRCGGNGFYLYVVAFEGQYNDYVYLANTSEPRNCGPERAQVMFVEPIGGGWYDVTLAGSLDRFGTPTATRMPPTLVPSATPVYIIVTATPVEPIIITATPASEAEATPDQ